MVLFGALLAAAGASAQVFVESSDAPATLADATLVPAGTTQIDGEIINTVTNEDVDTYRIVVPVSGNFTIEAIADVNGDPDMNLLVFNQAGQALAGDDDDGSACTVITSLDSLDSCLTLNLTAGTYFISVGDNNIGAFESLADYQAGTNDFMDNDSGILPSPSVEIAVIAGRESGPDPDQDEGGYVINFSIALGGSGFTGSPTQPVPVLPVWAFVLLIVALGGLGLHRYRQLSRSR